MTRSGYPARIDPRARLTIIVLVIVFVVGLAAALLLVDARRKSGDGGVQCPNALDIRCDRNGGNDQPNSSSRP
jgi:hypothetical protein